MAGPGRARGSYTSGLNREPKESVTKFNLNLVIGSLW